MAFVVLIGSLIVAGVILKLLHREDKDTASSATSGKEDSPENESEVCCGLHEICSKSAQRAGEIVYFDDDELDRFAGRNADVAFTTEELEEFRDVMLTLRPEEITLWQESLVARNIPVPQEIRDEMILLLDDAATGSAPTHS